MQTDRSSKSYQTKKSIISNGMSLIGEFTMNKILILMMLLVLAGCSASIGPTPSKTTTYTTAAPVGTPVVEHTTVTHSTY